MPQAPAKSTFHRSKYPFTLNISPFQLDERFGFNFNKKKQKPVDTTFIKDIFEEETSCISFFDVSKKPKRWIVSQKNHITKAELPDYTDVRCFHHHHKFASSPLGCPVRYVPSLLCHQYYSPQTRGSVVQRIPISFEDEKMYEAKISSGELDEKEYHIEHHNDFITDGVFCSWNCMMAKIKKEVRRKNPLYRDSEALAYDMYYALMGKRITKIEPAGPKTLLKEYDGPMSNEEYIMKFGHDTYTCVKNKYLRMVPLGDLYEQTQKF